MFFFSTKVLDFLNFEILAEKTTIPVIEPSKESIKEKPDEVELFPYSNSSIWSAFKNDQEENENNIGNQLNQNNAEKEKSNFDETDQEENLSADARVIKKKNNNLPNENYDDEISEKENINNTSSEIKINSVEKNINPDKESESVESKGINENSNNLVSKKGYYFIQLASLSDPKLVEEEWKRLIKVYKELSNKKYDYKKINLKTGKTFYRLIVGEFDDKESARKFCNITLKKNTCIIRYYD